MMKHRLRILLILVLTTSLVFSEGIAFAFAGDAATANQGVNGQGSTAISASSDLGDNSAVASDTDKNSSGSNSGSYSDNNSGNNSGNNAGSSNGGSSGNSANTGGDESYNTGNNSEGLDGTDDSDNGSGSDSANSTDIINDTEGSEASDKADDNSKDDALPKVISIDTPQDFAKKVNDIEPSNTEPVTIDTKSGDVTTLSGEDTSMREVFDISKKEEKALMAGSASENQDNIVEFLNEEKIYDVEEVGNASVEVSFPFAYRQVMVAVPEGTLDKGFGATKAYYDNISGCYILEFESELEAKEAYDELLELYDESMVMPNVPIHSQGIYSQTETHYTPETSSSWGNDYMHLDSIKSTCNSMASRDAVKVAVLDTGVWKYSDYFTGRTITTDSASFVSGEGGPFVDYNGHGTHVAGIIADGTPDNVQIMSLKVCNRKGSGNVEDLIAAINYASEQGADIMNMSIAFNTTKSYGSCFDSLIKDAYDKGCIMISAVGNEQDDAVASICYPAASPYVLGVSALKKTSSGVAFDSSYSNYGVCVDYSAPGTDVVSADTYNGSCVGRGTSMAAPHVTAAFATVKYINPELNRAEVTKVIDRNAKDLGTAGRDKYYGKGAIVFARNYESAIGASVKLSSTSYTYNGSVRKPSVTVYDGTGAVMPATEYTVTYPSGRKNVGSYGVKVTFKDTNLGSATTFFRINPKGTSIKKLSRAKKSITVKWKKQSGKMSSSRISGYQVQIAKNSKFTKSCKTYTVSGYSKTSKKITKLSRRTTYYVRVRTYKKVGSTKFYSSWSKARKVKTK